MKTDIIDQFINQLKAECPTVDTHTTPACFDGERNPAIIHVSPIQLAANVPAEGDDWDFWVIDGEVFYREGSVMIRVWPKLRDDQTLLYSIVSARSGAGFAELVMDKAYAEGKQMKASRNN
jgi:hypothetical protein